MSNQSNTQSPDFETAIAELEHIVSQLESGNLPLAQSVDIYKRGAALLKNCQQSLTEAEQQIRMLTETGLLADFDPKSE